MKRLNHYLFFIFCLVTSTTIAQRGIDGNGVVNAVGTIVNEYTTLTLDAAAGATTITVGASGLNANSRFGAGNTLAAGDLIMIIQMQGTTILGAPDPFTPTISNPNDATWGGVTNYNNTGRFEYCQVNAVPSGGTTITVDCPLTNSYTAAGRVQVIRVPRYNTLLIQPTGILTCQSWNGTTGGILAVEVFGNTTINAGGKINTTGTGFRGGALFTTTGRTTTVLYSCVSLDVGTNKGEGIAGYQADYTPYGGRYCRGAAANAGGGGNVWNCGGGGGANASTAAWTGQGNPNNTVAAWTTAWNLEAPGFSGSTSSGGGRGGYSFSNSNQNATLLGPGTVGSTNAWGGSYRYNLGGLGGRPLDYSTGRIFLGGGGGAGEQDNSQGGPGGAGGGIIYITSYGTITGSGNDSIISNGANGGSSLNTGTNAGRDAGGGAGGGGAILINSVGNVSGVFIKANGGTGGHQLANTSGLFPLSEAEGPGGGGGGGYIGLTSGPPAGSQQSLGGVNGVSQSPHITEFLPNGATMGGAGLTNQPITRVDTISVANATICSGNTATLTATINGTIPVTVQWYAAATGGASLGTGSTFTTPVLTTTTTYYVGFCPGTYRIPVVVTVNTSPTTSAAGGDQTVCATSATLSGNTATAGTGTWTLISGTGTITTPSSPTSGVTGLGLGANVFQWSITNAPCGTSTDQVTITNTGGPTTSAAGSDQTVCGTTATLNGNTATTGTGAWTLISGSGTITTPTSPTSGVTGLAVGANVFQWTITSAPCPSSTDQVTITGVASPTTSAAGTNQTICGTTATLAGNTATTGTGTWTLVSGTGTITTPSSPTSGVTGLGVGANVFQWSIANSPCPASTSSVTITRVAPPTTSAAGSNQTVCGTTATLAGNTATTGTGTWTLVSGTGTITTPSSPSSGVTGLGVGANVFQWSIANAPCTPSTSSVTITGVASPTTSAAGPNQTVCGTTATLAANTATTGTGTWTLISGTGTITTPSSPSSGVTGLGVGANVFQWSIANSPCPASTSSVTITGVAPPTTSAAGPNQSVCGTTATLAGNTATTGTGTWTLVSGTGTITTPTSPTSGVTGLGVGANVFQWSIANAPCTPSTSSVTITGVAAPTTSAAGPNQTVCGTTATLGGNTATTGTGTWTLISGTGTITTPTSPTSGVTGLGVGANVFQWSIANAPCPASTSTVTITGVAAPTASNAGPTQTICSSSTTLAGNAPTTGTGTWTLISGAGTITTPSSPTSGLTALGLGANIFQWTITNAPCTASSSTVTINNTGGPTTSAAGSNQTVCGTTATLTGNTPTTGTGLWTLVSGTGTITTPSSPTSGVTGLGVGANVFQWTISSAPCPPSTSTVTITGVATPTTSSAGPDQTVCGTTSTLAGNTATTGTGNWTLVSGTGTITTPSSPTSGVTGLGVGSNVFQWSIANAPCTPSTSTVTITGVAAPTTSAAGPNQTICGTTATLAGNTATTGTGTWTLISGTGTITTPTSPTSGVTGLGVGANVFQWSIANAPCPASTSTVTITVTAASDPTISSVTPICLGAAPFNLSAATTGGSWTGIGITDGINGTFNPASSGTGTFTITYTISGACGSIDTALVTVVPNDDATITPVSSLCATASPINLTAATAGGTWSGTGITNTSAGTFDPVAAGGIGSYTITYTISGACGSTDSVIVNVSSSSDATIIQPATICVGTSIFNLAAATTGGIWTGVGITDTINGTFNPSTAGVGVHIITYTISGTCGAMDTVSVTITASANATITSVTPVCANALPFNLTSATTGGTWSGTGITDAVNGTFNPSLATAGSNTITYSIAGACGDTATQTITVNALPTPTFTSDVTSGCAPLCVTFTESATNTCNTVSYAFGDGNTSISSTATNCYTLAGVYSVMLTCTDLNNCTGTVTVSNMITVAPSPAASFSMSPSGVAPVGSTITFTDLSSNGGNSLWDFGDPTSGTNSSSLSSDIHSYTSQGIYCVTLISSNTSCADTTVECVTIADDATILIPNIFSPNGDNINDVFYFATTSVKELKCSIYDRWGLKIAEWSSTNDGVNGWDGRTTSGMTATDGVYYFVMKANTLNNKIIEQTGFIHLLTEK